MGTRRARTVTAAVAVAVAVACMMLGALDFSGLIFRLGIIAGMLATTGLICARATIGAEWLERARQDGYDAGYADGCEVARPAKVVGIDSGSSSRRLTGSGAAHQLGQESDLGSGPDRVGRLGGV